MESGDDHEVCGFTACTFGKACRCRDAEAATSLLGSRLPSSPPVLADYMFEWDLSVAAELPLAMAASIAVTLDPWVGLPHARACACAGGPRFPSSAGTRQRVLHVLEHLVWYGLGRPARMGDWGSGLLNLQVLAFSCLVLLLASCLRSGRLSTAWRRRFGLQCGLVPAHSALLSCRPLALQLLTGAAIVAWPVAMAWATERRLRRQHAELCVAWRGGAGEGGRQQQQQQRGRQQDVEQQRRGTSGRGGSECGGLLSPCLSPSSDAAATSSSSCALLATDSSSSLGEEQQPPPSMHALLAPYQALTTTTVTSVKVTRHPGSFQEYAPRLAAAAPALFAAATGMAAPPPTPVPTASGPAAPGSAPPLSAATFATSVLAPRVAVSPFAALRCAVVRGCAQLIMWSRGLAAGAEPAGRDLAAASVHDGESGVGGQAPLDLQDLAEGLLPQLLPGAASGDAGGVQVQVGQGAGAAVAVMPGGEHLQGRGGGSSSNSSSGAAAATLLLLSPPAICSPDPGAHTGGGATVRMVLHSPRPQPARVLVLAERGAAGGQQQHGGADGGQLPQPGTAVLLREAAVWLVAGTQEVELHLTGEELATAVAGGGDVGVLQLVLVGPEHGAAGGDGQEPEAGAMAGVRSEMGEAGTAARPPSPPLHFAAPPLLLLPPAAAAEVCQLWDLVRQEAAAGVAEAHAEGGDDGSGAGGLEWEVGVWREHLAPLLGDLAFALLGPQGGGSGSQGMREAQQQVVSYLLQYLGSVGMGMGETAELLARGVVRHVDLCSRTGEGKGAGNHDMSSTVACAVDDAVHDTAHKTAGSLGYKSHSCAPAQAVPLLTPADLSRPAPCSPSCSTPSTPAASAFTSANRLASMAGTLLHHLLPPPPFQPASRELSYQASPLVAQAATARNALLGTAFPYTLVLLRVAWEQGVRALGPAIALSVCNWGSEAAAIAALLLLPPRLNQAAAAATAGAPGGSGGTSGNAAAAAVAAAVRMQDLAAVVVGPSSLLAGAVLVALGVLPWFPVYVGRVRLMVTCVVHRSLVLPSVQHLSVRQAWGCAPLLGLAEALQVRAMQPAWGWPAVVGTVAVWRVAAAAVAGLWERRARGRFASGVALRAAEAAARGRVDASGVGRNEGPSGLARGGLSGAGENIIGKEKHE